MTKFLRPLRSLRNINITLKYYVDKDFINQLNNAAQKIQTKDAAQKIQTEDDISKKDDMMGFLKKVILFKSI